MASQISPRRGSRWLRGLAIAAVVVIVAFAIAVAVVNSIIARRVRAEAQTLSAELGRPVEIDRVSVGVFPSVGARMTGLRVGPGPGEGVPALEIPRATVRLAFFRTLASLGKRVVVRSIDVQGLRLNVVRLPDGTTNLERVQRAMAEHQPAGTPPKSEPAEPAGAQDRSRLRLERADLTDARIALVDRTRKPATELAIDKLEVALRNLEVGRPLEVRVQAAVLAPSRNLDIQLRAAPLPRSLVPTAERLVVKLSPVDLAPLAPFAPRDVGFEGGRLRADLDATLGAAVPGGSGPTRVQGGFRGEGLRFAGQPEGRTLTASLDADVQGDANRGDVRIGRLVVQLGPAEITGRGAATGLATKSPKVEGLEIASRGLDPAAIAEVLPPLKKALHGRIAGPIGLTVRGTSSQSVEATVDLTPVRLDLPEQASKAAGAPARLSATIQGGEGNGATRFETRSELSGLDLRPGGSLDKRPGDRLDLATAGSFRRSGESTHVELRTMTLGLIGDTVTGNGSVDVVGLGAGGRPARKFAIDLKTAHLDLDRLLLPSKPDAKPKPPDPATYAGLSGRLLAHADTVRVKKADLHKVEVDARIEGDEVTLSRADAEAFGGSLSASGTRTQLANPSKPFHLLAELRGIETKDALASFAPEPVVSGKLQSKVDLTGNSATKADLMKSLTGLVAGDLRDGKLHGKDLVASTAEALAKALPFGVPAAVKGGGVTPLGADLPFSIRFQNGTGRLEKPIRVATAQGDVEIGGGFRVDGNLDLTGTVALAPATVGSLTGGKARPDAPVPVSYHLVGPAWKPSVANVGLGPAVNAIGKQAGAAALGRVLGTQGGAAPQSADQAQKQAEEAAKKKAREEAEKRLKGIFGG